MTLRRWALVAGIAGAHYGLYCIIWALHPGHRAPGAPLAADPWLPLLERVLAFPLLWLPLHMGMIGAIDVFSAAQVFNSLLWGLAGRALLTKLV